MLRKISLLVCVALLVLTCYGIAQAEFVAETELTVSDSEFENIALLPAGYNFIPATAGPHTGGWGATTGNAGGVLINDGTYTNTNVISNASGHIGFLETPAGGQYVYQDLTSTYQVGKAYKFQVGVANRDGYEGQATDKMQILLLYRDDLGAPQGVAASAEIVRNTLSDTALQFYDVTMSADTLATDAWAGKDILLQLAATYPPSGASGSFIIDHTQLWEGHTVSTPEPNTIVLLSIGMFGLLAYAWRKRK